MYKPSLNQQFFYRVASADWEYVVIAQNFAEAASLALAAMLQKFGTKLNIGFNLVVSQMLEDKLEDEVLYAPQVLSDIGYHTLGKNLDEVCKNYVDNTKK